MAEIKIEKKSPIWPWILVILIILAAIYFFWAYNDKDLDGTDDVITRDTISQVEEQYDELETAPLYTGTYGTVKSEQAFADYFKFVDSVDTDSADKSFYRTGFLKLIAATKRQAELDSVDVSSNLTAATESAEKLTNATTPSTKSSDAKKAATEISNALKAIQKEDYANLTNEVSDVDEAVTEINGNETLEKQSSNIDSFFDTTARLIQKMNETEYNQ